MQKDKGSFSFQYSYSSKNTIKVRRVAVSRRLLQTGSILVFIVAIFSTLGAGLHGILRNTAIAQDLTNSTLLAQIPAAKFDYSRPAVSAALAVNSGGPIDVEESTVDEPNVEAILSQIQQSSDAEHIPNMWAHMGKINNEFGFRRNPFGGRTYEFHAGMDIDGERGDLVVAPAAGTVTKAGWQGGYGQMIEVDHGNGLISRYGHLSKLNVAIGDAIARGQLIGFVGSTGRSTGPHLHYELRLNEHPINPRRFLPPEPADIQKPE
jgi:murein DD-endopeptidase MepM/ murein hydrolase activator NlpD